jgi:hypothetical protein
MYSNFTSSMVGFHIVKGFLLLFIASALTLEKCQKNTRGKLGAHLLLTWNEIHYI